MTSLAVCAVIEEADELPQEIDAALDNLSSSTESVQLDMAALEDVRGGDCVHRWDDRPRSPHRVGEWRGRRHRFVGGSILGAPILYYVLKDGPEIRSSMIRWLPEPFRSEGGAFVSSSVRAVRGYWAGRSVMSALVTLVVVSLVMGLPLIATIGVVNFVGGFVPYIGAFIGGSLASLLALSNGGIDQGLVMLVVVPVANLLLENLLEPRIKGDRLPIHPLAVLLATTAGGVVGRILDLLRRLRGLGAPAATLERADQFHNLAVPDRDAAD